MDKFFVDFHHFAFRMHSDIDVDQAYERIMSVLKKPVKKIEYRYSGVVSKEIEANRPHIQSYLVFEHPHKTIRDRLKQEFKLFGNADWSFVKVKDKVSYLSYVLKENNYRHSADLLEEVQQSPDWIQPDSSTYDREFKELKEQYLTTQMSDYNFLLNLLEIYSTYSKTVYIAHIRALWLGLANKRNISFDRSGYRVSGNSRPFRHYIIEQILRDFCVFD